MKISFLSDFHLGYAWNTELEQDSFEQAEEAIEKALDSDLIILCGDIFDTRIPKTDVWARAMHILSKPILAENKGMSLVRSDKDLKKISKRTLKRIPVIAIHGTHERRGKGLINAIEALEHAGLLIHLHCNFIVFEKEGKRVAIHGMSGVPERYAKDVLEHWNPKPVENCFNILLLHQSIEPFVYSPLEPPSLNLSNLPRGFDLIVDGHLHTRNKIKIDGSILLFPGSTVVTQLKREESENPRGFYKIDINIKGFDVEFVELKNARKFFYEEVELSESIPIRDQIESRINNILLNNYNFEKSPMIRIKITGRETSVIDKEIKEIEKKYSEKAILKIVRELRSSEVDEKIEFMRNLMEKKLSVEEIGLKVLLDNLEELKFEQIFEPEHIFKLLIDGEIERTMEILMGTQKTLIPLMKTQKSEEIEEEKKKKLKGKTLIKSWIGNVD